MGAVVAGVFLLCRFGWVVGLLISGSGVRVVGATARERFLRIELRGLRVLTAPCPAPPGFRTPQAHLRHATGASSTRHRRIFDTPQAHLRHATGASSTCAGMTPCQARGRLGAEGDPRAAVVRPAVLVYAVPGILPAFAIASGAEKSDVLSATGASATMYGGSGWPCYPNPVNPIFRFWLAPGVGPWPQACRSTGRYSVGNGCTVAQGAGVIG